MTENISLNKATTEQASHLSVNDIETLVLNVLDDTKAKNTVSICVDGQTTIAERFIIASATSNRHMASIANKIVEACKQNGVHPLGVEGERDSEWVLVDLFDIIVHIMLPTTREYYDLESLWSHKPSTRDDKESQETKK